MPKLICSRFASGEMLELGSSVSTANLADLAIAREMQDRYFVFDAHSDVPLFDVYPRRRLRGETQVMKRIHLPRYSEGGVHGAIMTVQCDCSRWDIEYCGALKQTLEVIDSLYVEEKECEGFQIAKTGSDLEKIHSQSKLGVLMGLEGGKAIEGSLEALRCLYKLGVRSMALSHNVRNQFADGAGCRENYGLTDLGRKAIEEIDNLRMILDLAHISERGFYDALEITKNTPIISHSACGDLFGFGSGSVPWRNVTDKQIQKLADKGGVIGIAFLKPFFTSDMDCSVTNVIQHIEHVIELVGIDHIGLGLDYVDYATAENQLLLGETHPYGQEMYIKDLENITKIPNFTLALLRKGYSEVEISKIMGGNFKRIIKKILG